MGSISVSPARAVTVPIPRSTSLDDAPGRTVCVSRVDLPAFPEATAWRITYLSTDTHDRPHVVAGTVIAPSALLATAVVGYAPGTHGLGDSCAPSRLLGDGTEWEAGFLQAYLDHGYAVAVTDYDGYSGAPTFVNGLSEGRAVLDVVRAAMTIPEADLPGLPVALSGYSQGGHAVGWAAQIAADYAPELDLRAVAVGAPVPDIIICKNTNDGTYAAGLMVICMMGLDHAYPELDLDSYLTDRGRKIVAEARDQCLMDLMAANAFLTADEFVDTAVFEHPDWQRRAGEQLLGGLAPSVPVLVYHSPEDDILEYDSSVLLRDRWRALGAEVDFRPLAGGNHLDATFTGATLALGWIHDQLGGQTGECSSS